MIIDSIKLIQFRQFDGFYAQDFHDRLNVIVGRNAQGKTTVLEAISLLTQLKSFRANKIDEIVQHEQTQASVSARITKPTRSEILIGLESRKKNIKIDGKKIASAAKYPFLGASVSFIPDDLYLIKGGPDSRRQYFDDLVVSLEPSLVKTFQQFQKILKQRNRVLKTIKEGSRIYDQLELWTQQYIEVALKIYKERQKCVEKVVRIFPLIYQKLFEVREEVFIEYQTGYESGVPDQSEMESRLERLRVAEAAGGYTLTGPHRDDYELSISGLQAKSFASQGQTRSLVIALKIVQLELNREIRSWSPILLLDDIISELDDQRVQSLVNFLAKYPGQMFVSTAESSKLKTLHEQFSSFHLIDLADANTSQAQSVNQL